MSNTLQQIPVYSGSTMIGTLKGNDTHGYSGSISGSWKSFPCYANIVTWAFQSGYTLKG